MTVEQKRSRKNEIWRERYATDPVFREKQKAERRKLYANNLIYREMKKAHSAKHKKNNPKDLILNTKVCKANSKAKKLRCKGKICVNDIRTLMTDPFLCYYCSESLSLKSGKRGEFKIWEIDHKTPLSRGGLNILDNIVATCHRCNKGKDNQTEEEFLFMCQKVVNQVNQCAKHGATEKE